MSFHFFFHFFIPSISFVWYFLLFFLITFKILLCFFCWKVWRGSCFLRPHVIEDPVRLVFQWKFTCSLSSVCLASKMTNAIKCELCMYEMGFKMNVRIIAKCKLYCDSDWNSTIYKISLVGVTCVFIKFIHTTVHAS